MDVRTTNKKKLDELVYFGGSPLFSVAKSTSSLAQPNFDKFLHYSQQFFARQHYTNNGVLVKQLEARLAELHKSKFCVTFCSGFWALVLAISELKLNGKSEIIMPSLTYRRMADIAAWTRLKPRFCEVDVKSLAMTKETVEPYITEDTALILAVHPIVNCCDVEGLLELSEKYQLPILFDAVESVYESLNIGKVGQFGDAECFSMHASKLLNGFEGGYITTNSKQLAHKLALLRSFGFEGQDNCVIPGGLNAKLNEIHAAMALANLDEIGQLVADNKLRYRKYQSGLAWISGIRLLEFNEAYQTSYKNIVIELNEGWPLSRDETIKILNSENILARAYYSPPLHLKKMDYPHIPATLKVTEMLADRFILLPCGDFVTCDDIDHIVKFLGFIASHGVEMLNAIRGKECPLV